MIAECDICVRVESCGVVFDVGDGDSIAYMPAGVSVSGVLGFLMALESCGMLGYDHLSDSVIRCEVVV